MTKAKPRRPSSIDSMAYGHFEAVLSQVTTDGIALYIADLGSWDGEAKQKPGKAD